MKEQEDKEKIPTKTPRALREEEILHFWEKNKIFEKSEAKEGEAFVFYDGPPFATGLPHYGHILPGTIKDVIPRYWSMKGKKLRRRWGWDCHGLPMENEIEKELGISGKKAIEEYGVEKFNAEARKRVLRYADDWKKIIPRMGRFIDMEDDYRTMDASYTESVWWAFKTLDEKGLIYKGFKAMQMCPRCGTTLSNFEVSQGYKDIVDLSAYAMFKLEEGSVKEEGGNKKGGDTFLLAWTTTPWTLPGNVALAVNPKSEYVKVKSGESFYILAEGRFEALKEKFENPEVIEKVSGEKLVGKSYIPPFKYFQNSEMEHQENAWKVYGADFVSGNDGTGVVHIAPAFGEDDLNLSKTHSLPIIFHVDAAGKFIEAVKDFAGVSAKPKENPQETDIEIIKYLAGKGILFAKEKITHSYPHCWRCETPLLNYASSSWFVKVTAIKESLVEENNKIHWVPESIGKYRFGNWLAEARDWAISRSRFWGAPLPVWENADGKKRVVIGSLETFRKYVKKSGNKYLVIRHGQGENNATGIIHGKSNSGSFLTELGRKQVRDIGHKLKGEKIDLIISSPFERAKQTAEILAEEIGISKDAVLYDERIEEIHTGEFDGKTNDEYHAFFSPYTKLLTKRPKNGENLLDVRRRAMEFLYELETKYQNKTILLSSHEYVAWMLWAGTFGWSESQIFENKKEDFLRNAEYKELPFVPLPHNRDFELDYHRPFIDEIELLDEEGNSLKRVSEVFDCWFESGSMPYGQWHFPFDTKNFNPDKERGYPADFIAEGLDQTRGWFYSLLVLGVALFGKAPFKNVVVNGLILAGDGQKMSKRLKNYPDLSFIVDRYGADPLRLFLMQSGAVHGEDVSFSERGIDEVNKKVIGRLLNCLSFLEMYGSKEEISFKDLKKYALKSENALDRWVVARFCEAGEKISSSIESYELDRATRSLGDFVDDLSTWYVRRSRERLKSENKEETRTTERVLRFILLEFSKCVAPFIPFTAEQVYLHAKTSDSSESVHLENWPHIGPFDTDILSKMEEARKAVSGTLLKRAEAGIKIRQPLRKLTLSSKTLEGEEELLSIIGDEVNVKEVVVDTRSEALILLDTVVTEELALEGKARDIIRTLQEMRKKAGLSLKDKIVVGVEGVSSEILTRFEKIILSSVNASSISSQKISNPLLTEEVDGIKLSIAKAP